MKKFLTVREVAERLGVNEKHVYGLCYASLLERHKFGRAVRISEAEVERFVEASKVLGPGNGLEDRR